MSMLIQRINALQYQVDTTRKQAVKNLLNRQIEELEYQLYLCERRSI